MTTPTPQTWTLRLKSHKTTVLLHIDPLSTFPAIKSALYTALQETGLRDPDTAAAIPLPASPADIQLGRPANINDPSEGFRIGEWERAAAGGGDNDEDGKSGSAKGKGRAKVGAKKTEDGTAVLRACAKGAGLRDGAVLAFRWVGDGVWDGREDKGVADMDIDGAGAGRLHAAADMWGVKLASFEDAYGVENGTDVGGGPEFEG
ncbi:hypothetical protein ACN47E_008212 [Coniothyrium glycines]